MVGFAWNATREAFFGGHRDRLMLLTYETMVSDPARAVDAVYDFIGEPRFAHDFERLEMSAEDFDRRVGSPGLHTVRSRLKAESRPTVLPPDLWAMTENDSFWMNPDYRSLGVRVV